MYKQLKSLSPQQLSSLAVKVAHALCLAHMIVNMAVFTAIVISTFCKADTTNPSGSLLVLMIHARVW